MTSYEQPTDWPDKTDLRIDALQELSSAMLCTDDIGTLSNLMLDCAASLTQAERASLMFQLPGKEFCIIAARGFDLDALRDRKVQTDKGIAGHVIRSKTPYWVQDIESNETLRPFRKAYYQTNSFICCPVVPNSVAAGVLNVADKQDRTSFSPVDFKLIQMLANQAAAAFDRAFIHGQLKTRMAELEDANARIARMRKMEAEFAIRCSHDLRTPLNSIRGAALFLQKNPTLARTEQREFYQIINQDADRMLQTVQTLLTCLHPQDETRPGNALPINFRELIENITGQKALRALLAKSSVRLTTSLQENPADLLVDKNRYADLVMSVMELAMPYLQQGDVIALKASDNSHARLQVSFPRRLPEPIVSLLRDPGRDARLENLDLRMRISAIRKAIDANCWELQAENRMDRFEAILLIPQNTRATREKVARRVLNRFADFICELLALNTCSIMVIDPLTNQLTIQGEHGLSPEVVRATRLEMGERIAGQVALEGLPRLVGNVETEERTMKLNRPMYSTQSLLSVPIVRHGRVLGVLNLNNKRSGEPFTEADLALATALGERIANIIEGMLSSSLTDSALKMHLDSLDYLIEAVQNSPRRTSIFGLMRSLAQELRLPERDMQDALYASLLFDLGLSVINTRITAKKDLSAADMSVIRTHPLSSIGLISQFEISDVVRSGILHHHERYDGTGYPAGLQGEAIPLISRMLAVVDAYTAMTSERIYRKSMSAKKAMNELIAGAGSFYDPTVVAAFQRAVQGALQDSSRDDSFGNA